jgi:hypothetical protein
MAKKYAPATPHAKWHRPGDADYARELIAAAGLSQRGAAVVLGINERSMRNKVSEQPSSGQGLTYAEQFMLETLAGFKLTSATIHRGSNDERI